MQAAKRAFEGVVRTAAYLGVPLSTKKHCPPSTTVEFLGFILDSVDMSISLPQGKQAKYRRLVVLHSLGRKSTKKKLLSLIGKLQHVCSVLKQGRPFLRRLIDRANSVSELRYLVKLSPGVYEDLRWWATTLESWVGTKLITFGKWRCIPDLCATSDASGSWGFGIVCGRQWCYGKWSARARELNIAVLELIPLIIAAETWGATWSRKRILFQTDNASIVACADSWLPKDNHLTRLFRRLATAGIKHSFDLKVIHIPGKLNVDADDLSRGRIRDFQLRNPHVHSGPETIRSGLVEELTEEDD
jgi:hypothetical protein